MHHSIGGRRASANNWADLTNGSLDNPISLDCTGLEVITDQVWTGTDPDGYANSHAMYCENWTSDNPTNVAIIGDHHITNSDWTADTYHNQ